MVSSMGYVVLSGKMQVDRQLTHLSTCTIDEHILVKLLCVISVCPVHSAYLEFFGTLKNRVIDGNIVSPELHLEYTYMDFSPFEERK